MAKLETRIPEIVGGVRGAQRSVRYVSTGEGRDLMATGRQISQGSKLALKGLDMMADLADERHRASYAKAMMEAEAEAGQRFAEEKKRVGFDAEGSAQRVQQIYAEVGAKYRSQVAPRYQDQFDTNWTRHSGGQFRSAVDFEFRNVRSATVTANQKRIEGARDRQDWEEMESAYEENYRLTQGRVINNKSLEAFDRDVADGDGVLTVNGKRLRITEKDEGEGTISKARIAKVREAMEAQASAYNKGLTDLYDVSHAEAVDTYLNNEDIIGAREYLTSIREAGIPVSDKVFSTMEKAVRRHEEVQEVKTKSEKIVTGVTAAAENPRYNTPDQDAAFFAAVEKAPDKVKRAAFQKWREIKAARDANFQLDLYNFSKEKLQTVDKDGKPVALSLSEQEKKIDELEDSPLKEELKKIHKRKVTAFENEMNAKPEYITYCDEALSQFSRDLGRGYAVVDGRRVALGKPAEQEMHLRSLGLTKKYQIKASEYMKDSKNMVSAAEVEDVLKKVFKGDDKLTTDDIRKYVPFIQRVVEDRRGTLPLGGKADRSKWIKEQVEDVLTLGFEEAGGMIYDTNYELKGAIEAKIDPDKLYLDEDNFKKFRDKQNRVWDLRGANTAARRDYKNFSSNRQLKKQGLTPASKGRYFIKRNID